MITVLINLFLDFTFQRGFQTVSMACRLLTSCMLCVAIDRFYLCLTTSFEWLDLLYYFSAVKLLITIFKYIPQVYLNFTRKSTKGKIAIFHSKAYISN